MTPTPFHLLRTHAHPLHALAFSSSGQPLLYAADEDGYISITDLRVRRVVAHWRAHEGGVLTVAEWDGGLVSHGRDNEIHFHSPFPLLNGPSRGTGLTALQDPPKIVRSLTVNALNFCKFGMAEVPGRREGVHGIEPAVEGEEAVSPREEEQRAEQAGGPPISPQGESEIEGFLAVPNLIDTESVDIYVLPSLLRLHAAILPTASPLSSGQPSDAPRSGLVMALNIHFSPKKEKEELPRLRLVVAFEDGRVESWSSGRWRERSDRRMKLGEGVWEKEWSLKGHNEAIMAMTVSPTHDYAYSVSADHLLCRYSIHDPTPDQNRTDRMVTHSTKQIGNGCVAVMADGRVVAVGGWDGSIRLFSAKSFKLLGKLEYHRDACHVITFAPALSHDTLRIRQGAEDDDEEEYGSLDRDAMARWMVSGGKDKRIAMWELMDFTRRR